MTKDEQRLRQELVEQYQRMGRLGLNELSSGNLSARFGERMLISPNGATSESITVDSIVGCSLDGEWEGARKPSSEWRMHAAIYKRHEEAQAVVHTHSDYCVALASTLNPLPGFHYLVGVFGGNDVPCVPYSTFGSQSLADDAAAALGDRTACLLGNHGMIARGLHLKRAANTAYRLELRCRQNLLACQLGKPALLTDADWKDFFAKAEENQYGKGI
jgi:L-fuculose-phosphate aldolase